VQRRAPSMPVSRAALASVVLLALPFSARAADVELEGYYQARGRLFSSLSLDRTISQNEGTSWQFQHRLLLRPRIHVTEAVAVMVDVRALDGTVWGTTQTSENAFASIEAPLSIDLAGDDLRSIGGTAAAGPIDIGLWRAWGEVHTKIGTFKFGRQPLHWGLGIWQNDGTGFNTDYGDSADRVSWEHMIQNVWLRAAVDVNTEGLINETDDTTSYNLAAAYRTERMEGGLQFQYRRRGGATRFDLYTVDGAFDLAFGPAGVAGEVTVQLGNGDLEGGINDVNLVAVGAMLDVGITLPRVHVGLEAGLATGDATPGDSKLRAFTFDRDYNVGFLMFEQPMPTLASSTPDDEDGRAYDQVLTGNAVSNAILLKPRGSYEITRGLWADASFLTARTAKVPDSLKAAGRNGYGYEFDVGLRYQGIDHFTLTGQFGAFLPGKYFTAYEDDAFSGFNDPVLGGQFIGRIDF
jgi:hypothetical protein